jgi:Txe/YoeB family toxin of Txe-Axe toxin-antitoxin module
LSKVVKSCQKVVKKVKKLSKSFQKFVKNCQKAVKKLSKLFKKLSKKMSKVVKKMSKKLSKSCQKAVKSCQNGRYKGNPAHRHLTYRLLILSCPFGPAESKARKFGDIFPLALPVSTAFSRQNVAQLLKVQGINNKRVGCIRFVGHERRHKKATL